METVLKTLAVGETTPARIDLTIEVVEADLTADTPEDASVIVSRALIAALEDAGVDYDKDIDQLDMGGEGTCDFYAGGAWYVAQTPAGLADWMRRWDARDPSAFLLPAPAGLLFVEEICAECEASAADEECSTCPGCGRDLSYP